MTARGVPRHGGNVTVTGSQTRPRAIIQQLALSSLSVTRWEKATVRCPSHLDPRPLEMRSCRQQVLISHLCPLLGKWHLVSRLSTVTPLVAFLWRYSEASHADVLIDTG